MSYAPFIIAFFCCAFVLWNHEFTLLRDGPMSPTHSYVELAHAFLCINCQELTLHELKFPNGCD